MLVMSSRDDALGLSRGRETPREASALPSAAVTVPRKPTGTWGVLSLMWHPQFGGMVGSHSNTAWAAETDFQWQCEHSRVTTGEGTIWPRNTSCQSLTDDGALINYRAGQYIRMSFLMSVIDELESGEQRPEWAIDPHPILSWRYLQTQKSLKKGGGQAILRKNPVILWSQVYTVNIPPNMPRGNFKHLTGWLCIRKWRVSHDNHKAETYGRHTKDEGRQPLFSYNSRNGMFIGSHEHCPGPWYAAIDLEIDFSFLLINKGFPEAVCFHLAQQYDFIIPVQG